MVKWLILLLISISAVNAEDIEIVYNGDCRANGVIVPINICTVPDYNVVGYDKDLLKSELQDKLRLAFKVKIQEVFSFLDAKKKATLFRVAEVLIEDQKILYEDINDGFIHGHIDNKKLNAAFRAAIGL